MPAYVIADIEITDPAGYEEYRRRVPATVAQYGGRYLVRGGAARDPGGQTGSPRRLVVLEFPSLDQARRWYDSEEYREPQAIRHRCSRGHAILVEGACRPCGGQNVTVAPGRARSPPSTLDRPEYRNSLSDEHAGRAGRGARPRSATTRGTRVVIVTGAPPVFSAGAHSPSAGARCPPRSAGSVFLATQSQFRRLFERVTDLAREPRAGRRSR